MSKVGTRLVAAIPVFASAIGLVAVVAAQPQIRIGASASRSGAYAALSENQLRGYQLCVKHTNDKGGVLGRKLELEHGWIEGNFCRALDEFVRARRLGRVLVGEVLIGEPGGHAH